MKLTAQAILNFHCPRWDELPALSLYMDQVLLILEETLEVFGDGDEKIITPTMIHNYVKQKIIEPPKKKKYGRSQLAGVIVLSIMKRVLSIPETSLLISRLVEAYGQERAYDLFCQRLEQVLGDFFSERKPAPPPQRPGSPRDGRILDALNAALTALAGKLYFQACAAEDDKEASPPFRSAPAPRTPQGSPRR